MGDAVEAGEAAVERHGFVPGELGGGGDAQAVEVAGLWRNLVPVIAGNLVGGSVLVALVYYVIYLRPAGRGTADP